MAVKHTRYNLMHIALLVGLLFVMSPVTTMAANSTNYQVKEDFVGGGGLTQSNSSGYQAQDTAGAAAVGDSAGTAYKSQSGGTTSDDPVLTFAVNTASVNLGSLSTSLTRTGTATFSVLNYTSYGYIVQTIGSPPSNGAYTLTGMSSPAASATNTEQFGINLVANTSPTTLGADPVQVPSNIFSFGAAATGYNTANTYKYVSGNTIASSVKSSGRTDYTISYIANMSNNTPGGSYSGNQVIVCTGTY